MTKSIFYRIFGIRKVPKEIRTRLESECIIFDEEGTSCALSFRNFRGTHRSSGRGWKNGVVGTLVITKQTFYVQLPFMIICDKPIKEAIKYLEVELQGPKKLAMKFGVEHLFQQSIGELTCYWRTDNASAIMNHISKLQTSDI